MASVIYNFFTKEDIEYLMHLPEVAAAKEKLNLSLPLSVVYFTIPITNSLRDTLVNRFGLDMSNASEIPMRWIKGDTAPHIDSGTNKFENTYLAYINESQGDLVVENAIYPIAENTGFVFNEGMKHMTQNTGIEPRLLLGPMSEFVMPVGATITYYMNYADAYAMNGNSIATQGATWVLNDTQYIYGSIGSYTAWRIAFINDGTPSGASFPANVYSNGFDLATLGIGSYGFYVYPASPCFLQGTKILCQKNGVETYIPIEGLKPGTLVKTSRDGYKKIELIGRGEMINPGNDDRTENRLYKCSKEKYPELFEDLYITGCHSILVDNLTEEQKEKTIKQLGRIFVTDKKYRLMASVDERAKPWNSEGKYTIWHIALENEDDKKNYGIYANGMLIVETCSINFLKNRSNMNII